MPDTAISIKSLEKHYSDIHALKCVNLDVPDGQTLVICGPSGSGKSTQIRCINGLETYTSGSLDVLGLSVGDDTKVLDQVRKRVGMVFQNLNLFPHLSILENCVLPQVRARGRAHATANVEAINQLEKMQVDIHAENSRTSFRVVSSSVWHWPALCV